MDIDEGGGGEVGGENGIVRKGFHFRRTIILLALRKINGNGDMSEASFFRFIPRMEGLQPTVSLILIQ